MKTFHLTVAKVGENLFEGEALSVSLPGREGVFQILAEHEPCVSELRKGELCIKTANDQLQRFTVPEGSLAEISCNQATILL